MPLGCGTVMEGVLEEGDGGFRGEGCRRRRRDKAAGRAKELQGGDMAVSWNYGNAASAASGGSSFAFSWQNIYTQGLSQTYTMVLSLSALILLIF
ncbi:hypothetical protein SESBI_37456 [Sesbania bispinosa]|nr:hypothetical protein SESBI_37456 [Sesbania bispinosa]